MSVMTVFTLCERAIGLVRGKRLILNADEYTALLNLDYDALTRIHAQDEACVCVLHFEQVRDRLLQIYPWVFARRRKTYGTFLPNESHELPDGFLTMLCVKKDGRPIEYEQSVNLVIPDEADEIIYTYKVEDVKQWPPVFCDVFCYALAVEICSAVTGKPEYVQLLEQKGQELIQRAYQIGAIKADVPVTLKEELYNRAIGLAHGQRTLKPESNAAYEQGTDNFGDLNSRRREEIAACERASESVRDRLFELYAWKFARRNAYLTVSSGSIAGWKYNYPLPEDCVKVLNLFSDDEPADYEECYGRIYCDANSPTVRYTARITDISEWPGIFRDVYVCNLAQEIILSSTHNLESVQLLEAKSQSLIRDAVRTGAIRGETELPPKEELFRRAISLAHGTRAVSPTGNASIEQGIDITGDINYYAREEILICKRSYEYHRDNLLKLYGWRFARKTATLTSSGKISGWKNAYVIPSDCIKVLSVLSGDEPVEYEESDGKILCDGDDVTLRYTRAVSAIKDFDSVFMEVLCGRLAIEIITGTRYNGELIKLLEQREQSQITEAYKLGVIMTETRIPVKKELFDRAIGLVKGMKTGSPDVLDTRIEDEVSTCYRSYETLRDRLLQLYEWVFARRTEIPAQLSESVPGWKYTYMLPDDCLKVLSVIADDKRVGYGQESNCRSVSEISGKVEILDYETAGSELYANHAPVYVRYTARITKESDWAASFKDALVILIAIEICHNVTEGLKLIQILEQRLQGIIENARASGVIRPETRLPLLRDSRYRGAREVPYLDYSGIPTLPCTPLDYCCGGEYERLSGEFCFR